MKMLSYESHYMLKRRLEEAEEQVNIYFPISFCLFLSSTTLVHYFWFSFTLWFSLPPSIHLCSYFSPFFSFFCILLILIIVYIYWIKFYKFSQAECFPFPFEHNPHYGLLRRPQKRDIFPPCTKTKKWRKWLWGVVTLWNGDDQLIEDKGTQWAMPQGLGLWCDIQ